MATLSSPPGLPSGLAGFLDLRGTAIPIVRLDRLFSLPEQRPGLYTPLIILRGVPAPIGILVDSVRRIIAAAGESFLPLPDKSIFRDCATAAVEVSGRPVYLLSPDKILIENERHLLAKFQAMAQELLGHLEERN